MLQRLGLADVLIKNPEVIILDEPTLGIDPTGVKEFLGLIVELSRAEGLTVLFSSHDLHHVQQVCDRVGLFVQGKLLAEGDIPSLSKKLFTKNSFVIQVGLVQESNERQDVSNDKYSAEWLRKLLNKIDGIDTVELTNGIFQVGCARDATAEIAKAIIESGEGLNYLNKKEYGLNDIYSRYFEGGDVETLTSNSETMRIPVSEDSVKTKDPNFSTTF